MPLLPVIKKRKKKTQKPEKKNERNCFFLLLVHKMLQASSFKIPVTQAIDKLYQEFRRRRNQMEIFFCFVSLL